MNNNCFELQYDKYLEFINKYLDEKFVVDGPMQEAAKYTISSGGKRLRPVITLAVCEALGGSIQDALPYAVAIEMIHNYSLIHDDLPCMDNDDERRGKPSCHIEYGETLALLAGDGLLTKAFNIASEGKYCEAIKVISDCAYKMVVGQANEFVNIDKSFSIEKLIEIYSYKTSALFQAAAVCGAIVAKASPNTQNIINDFAYNLGVAFQLEDDLLDSDEENTMIISILGKDGAYELGKSFSDKAVEALNKSFDNNEFLQHLTNKLIKRTN